MTIYDANDKKRKPRVPMRVFLDGKELHHVIYVDTQKGIVRHHGNEPKFNADQKTIKVYEEHGTVVVTPIK